MSGPVNGEFNLCELKLDHGDFIDRSQNEVCVGRQSIDERRSDRRLDHDRATLV